MFSGRYKALIVEGSGSGYLKTACDYAHLNPVRAGMLPGQERLLSHPNLLFVRPLVLSAARVITRADCPAATPPLKPNISPFRDRPFHYSHRHHTRIARGTFRRVSRSLSLVKHRNASPVGLGLSLTCPPGPIYG